MSQSFTHDGERERPGNDSSSESFDEQLAAEIADHLAASADNLARRGMAEDHAATLALERFGDVARVKRQCWWIHNGEEVMFRTLGIGLLSLLTIGVAVVGFGGWQLQHNLASRTEELSKQLESLSATQQAILDQQRPPEIAGVAYLGDPSTPAQDVEIRIFRFSEEPASINAPKASGVVVRRLRTDAMGRFDSGFLQSGEYCVLGPLLDPQGNAIERESLFNQLQSRPLYLTPGVGKSNVDLNLAASGQLRLAVPGIPNSVATTDEEVQIFVNITAVTDRVRHSGNRPVPPNDEPPREDWPLPLPPKDYDIAAATTTPADLPRAWWLPPRVYSVTLYLSFLPTKTEMAHVFTTAVTLAVEVTPDSITMVTANLIGDPLEKRFEDAATEYKKNTQAKLVPAPLLCQAVADKIELNVDLTD